MIEFNIFWIFYVSSGLRRVLDIPAGSMLSDWGSVVVEARGALETFRGNDDAEALFPKTIITALMLGEILSGLVPDVPPGTEIPNRKIKESEIVWLGGMFHRFLTIFQQECDDAFVIALERQRAFDLHTLIDSIKTAFDISVWDRFSEFSRREISEAARCLALERYTASGFHMLRAVENEVRDCAILVSRARPLRRDLGDYIQILKLQGADARLIAVLENIQTLT